MSSYTLDSDNETSEGHVIFVKNLNFDTNEDSLKEVIPDNLHFGSYRKLLCNKSDFNFLYSFLVKLEKLPALPLRRKKIPEIKVHIF